MDNEIISNEERDALLEASPARKVTLEGLRKRIAHTEFIRPQHESTLTICVLTLENGFTVVGQSACAHPENFNEQLGQKIAWDDAFGQLWQLEGYLLREELWRDQQWTKEDEAYLNSPESRSCGEVANSVGVAEIAGVAGDNPAATSDDRAASGGEDQAAA